MGSFVSASLTEPLTVVCARSRLMQNSPRTVSAVVNLFFFIIGCLKLLLVNRVMRGIKKLARQGGQALAGK